MFTKNKGFTLVEVIVVISVVIIISTILIANFPKFREQKKLQMSSHRLIQDLRRIQERALSPSGDKEKICGNTASVEEIEGLVVGAFFDEQNPDFYRLFVDCDENYIYSSPDKELSPIGLEKKVKIKNLSPPNLNGNLHIVFVPPNPQLFINGSPADSVLAPGVNVRIEICLDNGCLEDSSDSLKTRTIEINKSGLVELK